jgi:ornithine decarboxylase
MYGDTELALDRLRWGDAAAAPLPAVDEIVARAPPAEPLLCFRPAVVERTARRFLSVFPGRVLYAVKCNPDPLVIRALAEGGVDRFDVASLGEIELLRAECPEARLSFMHPVKSRAAIRDAYQRHGVREFALDSAAELQKIVDETGGAKDLSLFVRLAVPKPRAAYDLSGRFGAEPEEAARLLRAAKRLAGQVGLSFHVGSQCLEPAAYESGLCLAASVAAKARVPIDAIDVGGGFPVGYADLEPPPLADYMAAIRRGLVALAPSPARETRCEPGRALVAAGASLVVQVLLRRGGELFISDGVYGALSDAGTPGIRFPVRLVRRRPAEAQPLADFAFLGPTCDSADRMAGPFRLPADVAEGDFIEIGQVGAYGTCLRTAFNGFGRLGVALVGDEPLLPTPGLDAPAGAAPSSNPASRRG